MYLILDAMLACRGWDRYKGLLGVLRCAQHYALDGSKKRSLCSSSDGSGNGENGCGEGSDEEGSGRALLRTSTNNSGRDSGKKDGAGSKVVTVGKGSLGARSNASNDNWDFNPPVLLMTDDVVLRTMVADGLFRGFVGPAYIAHHLQRTTGDTWWGGAWREPHAHQLCMLNMRRALSLASLGLHAYTNQATSPTTP